MNANTIEFHDKNQIIIANGNVKAIIDQYQIESSQLIYNLNTKIIELYNNVKIIDLTLDSKYQSQAAIFDLSDKKIIIRDLYGQFKNATIKARSIAYDHNLYKGEFITMSLCNTCKNGENIIPFWKIRAKKLIVDTDTNNEIKLEDVYFDLFDKQIGYMPFFSLPTILRKGKTGFLMPNLQNKGIGYQLDIPFYFKATPNLDFTLYPAIGKQIIYGLNMRYKVDNGGYEITVYSAKLPFTDNKENQYISSKKPTNIKINTNLFYPIDNLYCTKLQQGIELGIKGEFALGSKPILLYKYDISNNKILTGNLYMNTIYNNSFASIDILNLHNLQSNKSTIAQPKTSIYNIYKIKLDNNPFSTDPVILTHIATNNIYNKTLSNRLSDILGEIKFMTKHYIDPQNKITYITQLTGYKSTGKNYNKSSINTALDIHWESKLRYQNKIIEPHIKLHLEEINDPLFSIYHKDLNIYSTTNNIHPYNIFSNDLYTIGNRSIMKKNGPHIDYGFILSIYNHIIPKRNKLFMIIGGRQYLSKQSRFHYINSYNQDLSLAMIRDKIKEKYILQVATKNKALSITNRTWFTNNFSILNNELYLDKKFNKVSTKVQYLFLNSQNNFNNQIKETKFEQFAKLQLKYRLSDNWSLVGKNMIKFGQNAEGYNITRPHYLKGKMQYDNECIEVGFKVKKEFNNSRKKFNDNVSSYNLYLKIPSI